MSVAHLMPWGWRYFSSAGPESHLGFAGPGHLQRRLKRLNKRLRLNPQQQDQLQQLMAALLALRAALNQQRLVGRAELLALLAQPALDQQRLVTTLQATARTVDEHSDSLVTRFAQFSDSLDDAQRQQLLRWLERRRPHPGHWRFWSRHDG